MAVVKPVADGSVGLPRARIDAAVDAAFVVLHPAAVGRLLAIIKYGQPAVIMLDAVVVKIGNLAQADLVAARHAAVAVKQIGMIVVHKFLDVIEPLLLPARIVGIPFVVARLGGKMVEIPVV